MNTKTIESGESETLFTPTKTAFHFTNAQIGNKPIALIAHDGEITIIGTEEDFLKMIDEHPTQAWTIHMVLEILRLRKQLSEK